MSQHPHNLMLNTTILDAVARLSEAERLAWVEALLITVQPGRIPTRPIPPLVSDLARQGVEAARKYRHAANVQRARAEGSVEHKLKCDRFGINNFVGIENVDGNISDAIDLDEGRSVINSADLCKENASFPKNVEMEPPTEILCKVERRKCDRFGIKSLNQSNIIISKCDRFGINEEAKMRENSDAVNIMSYKCDRFGVAHLEIRKKRKEKKEESTPHTPLKEEKKEKKKKNRQQQQTRTTHTSREADGCNKKPRGYAYDPGRGAQRAYAPETRDFIRAAWNDAAKNSKIIPILGICGADARNLSASLKIFKISGVLAAIDKITAAPRLRDAPVSFCWFCRPDTIARLLSTEFDNRPPTKEADRINIIAKYNPSYHRQDDDEEFVKSLGW